MAAIETHRQRFKERFRELFGEPFQEWVTSLLRALHAPGDFQKIRKTQGDGGLDGFVIDQQQVYQIFAPVQMTDSEAAEKIVRDFGKAQDTLKGRLKCWRFIH